MSRIDRNRPLPRNGEELFPDCKRCGIRISNLSVDHWCMDCRTIETTAVAPTAQRGYPDLPYTVTIHAPGSNKRWAHHPTLVACRDQQIRYAWVDVEDDWGAHHYVTDTLGHYQWPVIVITDVTDILTHWEGHQPKLLQAWAPAALEAAA